MTLPTVPFDATGMEITRIGPAVKAYQFPANPGDPLSGRANRVW